MHEWINKGVLLTCTDWFFAPDGQQYKAIWGIMKGIKEVKKELGIDINRAHSN